MTTVVQRPCRSCSAQVYDLEHVNTHRSAPIDIRPNPQGNVLINLEEGFYTIVRAVVLEVMNEEERQKLHTSHFATCPYADKHRKAKIEKNDAADRLKAKEGLNARI